MSTSTTPSLTSASSSSSSSSSRAASPVLPIQPDHFYRSTEDPEPVPNKQGFFDPDDDPLAANGIPVFKPTMDEFRDFEAYMNKIECWGMRSGIVKIIPPKEWTDSLPPMKEQLNDVKIKTPIEQQVHGTGGHFRQENYEKRKLMSVREWVELCAKDEYRAPGVHEVGLRSGGKLRASKPSRRSRSETVSAVKEEQQDEDKPIKNRPNAAAKHAKDVEFLKTFQPTIDWLPPGTIPEDYTAKFCEDLARQFWRNCGIGKPAWYGADSQGSLFTDDTKEWNVAHLQSALTRLLPSSAQGLPGVNTPYLYWGMWRATFAWHVEDMDLFSINYIHFGAPKFWYAIPQGRASAFEQNMRGLFPTDGKSCSQFLRHKQFLVSPNRLAKDSCAPNHCVQQAGEFIITYPRGYHAGFNLGVNCAESVNFALDSWLALGREAKACECIPDSVRIDVDQLLMDRAAERAGTAMTVDQDEEPWEPAPEPMIEDAARPPPISLIVPPRPKKRPHSQITEPVAGPSMAPPPKPKRPRTTKPKETPVPQPTLEDAPAPAPKVTLKIKINPTKPGAYPCCLCPSLDEKDLLPVLYPPQTRKDAVEAAGHPVVWRAHRQCADVIPETWVDVVAEAPGQPARTVVCGVDAIPKDRWNLKCAACRQTKSQGAPFQCTKGKCSKAFHISCAREGEHGVSFQVLRDNVSEVILEDPDDPEADAEGIVVKQITKSDVELLCPQHNPNVAAAKKADKLGRVREHLLALPLYSMVKFRNSSGLLEAPLLKVNEDRESVDVVWDHNFYGQITKIREFKWSSVILGETKEATQVVKKGMEGQLPYPPPGYVAPGYAYPPPGYAHPAAGYAHPPPGYVQGYTQPSSGYANPPPGYAYPPHQVYAYAPHAVPPPQPSVHPQPSAPPPSATQTSPPPVQPPVQSPPPAQASPVTVQAKAQAQAQPPPQQQQPTQTQSPAQQGSTPRIIQYTPPATAQVPAPAPVPAKWPANPPSLSTSFRVALRPAPPPSASPTVPPSAPAISPVPSAPTTSPAPAPSSSAAPSATPSIQHFGGGWHALTTTPGGTPVYGYAKPPVQDVQSSS